MPPAVIIKNIVVAVLVSIIFWPTAHQVGGDSIAYKSFKPLKVLKQPVFTSESGLTDIYLAPQLTPTSTSCGDNQYANYIYEHESGCSLTETNSIGCIGLGQDCNGALVIACPNLDYACENSFFTNYSTVRYGGWLQSYNFWIANHWW